MNQQMKWQEILLGILGWVIMSVVCMLILIVLAVVLVGIFIFYFGGG